MNRVFLTAVLCVFVILSAVSCSKKEKQGDIYICPMHPQITSDRPGSCSICGMDLVRHETGKKETEEEGNAVEGRAEVHISAAKQQAVNMKFEEVKTRPLAAMIKAYGSAAYDPELYSAQADYINALVSGGRGSVMAESAELKLKSLGLSEAGIRKLSGQKNPDRALISVSSGEAVVYAQVYQEDLFRIKAGDEAEITIPASDAVSLAGSVEAVDGIVDPETGSARVRIRVKKGGEALKPGMYLDIKIISSRGKYLSIYEGAVLPDGEGYIVFVNKGNGHFEPRRVILGEKMGWYYKVVSGLSEGETAVSDALFLVDSESRLKAAVSSMQEHGH